MNRLWHTLDLGVAKLAGLLYAEKRDSSQQRALQKVYLTSPPKLHQCNWQNKARDAAG